ncbi:MAG: pilus assembly protein PilP [Deltaproteobacteria bacterium]|nr:pilus assembly protein PilP [Deltaproteobacteria bacterium]
MMNTLKICAVSAFAVMLLASCQSKEPPAQGVVTPPKKAQVTPPPPPDVQGKPDEAAQAKPEAPKRRNPFSNYMLNVKAQAAEKGKRIKGPLECCELNVFRLIAVVNARDSSFGLVLTPDGKRYFVHVGDMMGTRDGKVIKLESRSLTVREYIYDEFGKLTGHSDTPVRLPEDSGLKR